MREKDYDAAAAARGEIRVRAGAVTYEYPPEAPLDVAVEWMDRQTRGVDGLKESAKDYMLANYRLVIGAHNLEEMNKNHVGSQTVDDVYRDLLDWWGLWRKPDVTGEGINAVLDQLAVLGVRFVKQEDRLAHDGLLAEVRRLVTELEERIGDAEDAEEEQAGNPA